ncbi:DUF5063 domain-containing protein [Inhella proteolytica]|uniref:DUF5063 domain-containing protein n=1 Tax=Inhella proteolytica TaxID=2795029 RepID=A0A931J7P4_9BURK|nr:DUF5063 domain-containing protein [Inhella proteolytica]MBH9578322.1 DUF5063 domain-containing protein [Inhella proteolytica]
MKPSNPIDQFAVSASSFCRWCEAAPSEQADRELRSREVRRLLARLIADALALPETNPGNSPDSVRATDDELKALTPRLADLPVDKYGVYFWPADLQSDPVVASLIDDLQEIYRDLRDGLWLYEQGHIDAAAWQWLLLFEIHWGHHASNALHALQGQTANTSYGAAVLIGGKTSHTSALKDLGGL